MLRLATIRMFNFLFVPDFNVTFTALFSSFLTVKPLQDPPDFTFRIQTACYGFVVALLSTVSMLVKTFDAGNPRSCEQ